MMGPRLLLAGSVSATQGADQQQVVVDVASLQLGVRFPLCQDVGFGGEHGEVIADPGGVALAGEFERRFGRLEGIRLFAQLLRDGFSYNFV